MDTRLLPPPEPSLRFLYDTALQTSLFDLFTSSGAVRKGHFRLTTGLHSDIYCDKDQAFAKVSHVRTYAWTIATRFLDCGIEAVVSPAIGAISLGTSFVGMLDDHARGKREIIFAILQPDQTKPHGFRFRSNGAEWVCNKKTLVIDDIVNTGGSVRDVVATARAAGADVVAAAAVANRTGVTAADLDVPELFTLFDIPAQSWAAKECPQCIAGIPLDTIVGHAHA